MGPGPGRPERGPAIPVRAAALRILVRVDREGAYADILLDRAQRELPDPRDRALLTELVMGTLRRRGTLDHNLSRHLPKPLGKADAVARNALRLGAYQLFYTRVPGRAAVHESVEAARLARGERIGGLVNAVLRRVAAGGREPALPREGTPERLPAELSAPPALLAALSRSLGGAEAEAFLREALGKPPFAVRANPFRGSREALRERLAAAGNDPVPCRFAPDGLLLRQPAGATTGPSFRAGEFLVMDEGAQLVPHLLSPRPGERLLDACAAPGGKTTQLAALAGGGGSVVAADRAPGRLRLLRDTLARTGAPGVAVLAHDFAAAPLPEAEGLFDAVLADVPCTGIGVIRRNPDAKWRFDPGGPARMAPLQRAILANAFACLRPGGRLLYCTCTPFREENEEVVSGLLRTARDARAAQVPASWPGPSDAVSPDGTVRLLPHRHGTDGFFAALIRKTGA